MAIVMMVPFQTRGWSRTSQNGPYSYPSLGLLANGTLENVDLYRQLGELLGQNRTKIELKIESK